MTASRKKPGKRKREYRRPDLQPAMIKARLEALELRKQGLSYRDIAAKQGCSVRAAWRRVDLGFRLALAEPVEAVRKLEEQRLDALLVPQYAQATKLGDREAAETCLRIMTRRARLFGLDAPTKTEASTTSTTSSSDLDIPVGMPVESVRSVLESLIRWEQDAGKKARLVTALIAIGGKVE